MIIFLKTSLDVFKSKVEMAYKRIIETEHKSIEFTQLEEWEKSKQKKKKKSKKTTEA